MIVRRLVWIALALFFVSFLLPAYGVNGALVIGQVTAELTGYECALHVLAMTIDFEHDEDRLYFAAFILSNLLMLTVPFLLIVRYRDRPTPVPLLIIQLLLLLHVASWWFRSLDEWWMIRSGYYVWLVPMIFMLAASLTQRRLQLYTK